ncbi:MAG TPA: LEA type 2 family protein [Thermoanaerobaculia bacterium]|jgi:LEA14-like dessication related protein
MKRSLTFGGLLATLCVGLSVLAILTTGCSTVRQALNIENPRYSIRDIRPRIDVTIPLSQSSIDFDFTVGVDNPNGVAIKLDQLDFDLYINNNRILDSSSRQGVNIPAKNYGEVFLRTRVGYSQLRNLFTEIVDIVRGERARYELRGTAHYDTPIGRLRFPVTVYSTGNDRRR